MQIHELTRKPLREASVGGAVSGAVSLAGGVGSQLINKLAAAQGVSPVFGGQDQATGAGAQGAAAAANDPLIKGLATSAAKEWKQDVYDLMKTERTEAGFMATNPSDLPDAKLRKVLEDMATRLIGDYYRTLAQKINPAAFDGKGAETGARITASIDDQIDAIIAQEQTNKTDPAKESALWNTFAQAVSSAKTALEFDRGGAAGAKPGAAAAGVPVAPSLSGAQRLLADRLGIDNQVISAIQAEVRRSGGALTPDMAALLGVAK